MVETKICSVCKVEKPVTMFKKQRRQCNDCLKKLQKERDAKYYQNHKEEKYASHIRWRKKNKEHLVTYRKDFEEKHKEEIIQYNKIYQQENKQELRVKAREREKIRRQTDPLFAIQKDMSRRISLVISKSGQSRYDYFPWTWEEFKIWIEELFLHPDNLAPDGRIWMTWENRGIYDSTVWDDNDPNTWTWQLDHVIPHSTFNYISTDSQEFRDCWALSNLRPLSAKQNVLDGINRIRHKV